MPTLTTIVTIMALINCSTAWSGILLPNSEDTQIWQDDAPAQNNVNFGLPNSRTVVAMDNKVYFLGSFDKNARWSPTVTIFDPKTNTTSIGPPMTGKFGGSDGYLVAAVISTSTTKQIIACGETEQTVQQLPKNVCQVFDNGSWMITSAPSGLEIFSALYGNTLTALGSKAYLIGIVGSSATTIEYDSDTEVWSVRTPPPTELSSHGAAMLSADTILTCGGLTHDGKISSTCLMYNATADEWSVLPTASSLKEPLIYFQMINHQSRIVVLGGRSVGNTTNQVQIYDRITDSFHFSPYSLPNSEAVLSAVSIVSS